MREGDANDTKFHMSINEWGLVVTHIMRLDNPNRMSMQQWRWPYHLHVYFQYVSKCGYFIDINQNTTYQPNFALHIAKYDVECSWLWSLRCWPQSRKFLHHYFGALIHMCKITIPTNEWGEPTITYILHGWAWEITGWIQEFREITDRFRGT